MHGDGRAAARLALLPSSLARLGCRPDLLRPPLRGLAFLRTTLASTDDPRSSPSSPRSRFRRKSPRRMSQQALSTRAVSGGPSTVANNSRTAVTAAPAEPAWARACHLPRVLDLGPVKLRPRRRVLAPIVQKRGHQCGSTLICPSERCAQHGSRLFVASAIGPRRAYRGQQQG